MFGVVCFPSLVWGVLLSLVTAAPVTASASDLLTNQNDALIVSLAQTVLPYMLWAELVVPPIIFAKMVLGLRKLHRDTSDDEQTVAIFHRVDGHTR